MLKFKFVPTCHSIMYCTFKYIAIVNMLTLNILHVPLDVVEQWLVILDDERFNCNKSHLKNRYVERTFNNEPNITLAKGCDFSDIHTHKITVKT